MSKRNKKFLKIATILLVIIAGLHFVPVYTQVGYLDTASITTPGFVNSKLCAYFSQPQDDHYRVVINGVKGFWNDHKILRPQNSGCDEWVRLKLYIF